MNLKKILAIAVALTTAVMSSAGVAASAEKYTYDLKTYNKVDSSAIVTYTLEYGPALTGDSFMIEDAESNFTVGFINTNVTDIFSISIETEQMASTDGRLASMATNRYGYTKSAAIASDSAYYTYNPKVFYGTYVELPYGTTNGFALGSPLLSLGYSSQYFYGFSHIKVELTCKISKNLKDEQGYGNLNSSSFVNRKGEKVLPTRAYFSRSNNLSTEIKAYPFKTSMRTYPYVTEEGFTLYTNNVVYALKSPKNIDGVYYFNPIAHINDVIAKSDDVSFTFVSYYDTQRVYNPYSYVNIDLFSGSLVVNDNYTLSLQDTDSFYWGKDSLTFTWSGLTSNSASAAKDLFLSMSLYTTRDWYWDSLIVESIESIEDVSAAAGYLDNSVEI